MQTKPSKKRDAAAAFQHILTLPSSAAAQATQKEKRSYKCGHCSTTFRRSEHCVRHERSHTLEKPFGCSFCGCHFSRKDLLVRHERTVHSSSRPLSSNRPAKRRRGLEDVVTDVHTDPISLLSFQEPPDVRLMGLAAVGGDALLSLSHGSSSSASAHHQRTGGDSVRSINSITEVTQPLTPPETYPEQISQKRNTLGPPVEDRNGELEFGVLRGELDFSELFSGTGREDDALGSSPHNTDGGIMVAAAVHSDSPNHGPRFPEFHGLENILEEATVLQDGSMTDLFHESMDDMTPGDEYIIPQTLHSQFRKRRRTNASDFSSQPLLHSVNRSTMSAAPAACCIDDSTRDWILQDLSASHPRDLMMGFCLPNSSTLQRYLDSYFSSFHKNFPILHLATFYPKGTKAHLLLAICCIGAQHCFEKRCARYLYEWTKRFVAVEDVKWKRVEVDRRAWLMRTKILLGFFEIWSAERELISDAVAEQGSFAGFFRSAQALFVLREEVPPQQQTWRDWVDIESFKRLCYGVYILQSLVSITFNLPAVISCADVRLPLPAFEDLWESPNAEVWAANLSSTAPDPKFKDTLEHYFGAQFPGVSTVSEPGPSAFGGLALVHGLLSQQWQVTQCRQSLQLFGFTAPTISSFNMAQESEKLLSRLQNCLVHTHQNISPNAGGSLWFCVAGLLRQAYIRQFTQFEPASAQIRTIICPEEGSLDLEAVVGYVLDGTPRSAAVTHAAEKATDSLDMPVRAGHATVCKTAGLNWSADHAIASWDCILFLLRWMFSLENSPRNEWDIEEIRVYDRVRHLLEETDLDPNAGGPLTPKLADMWGDVLATTWVWGITPALGNGMKILAERLRGAHEGF